MKTLKLTLQRVNVIMLRSAKVWWYRWVLL